MLVAEPVVYIGGLVNTAVSPTESDMAVPALDTTTGDVLWSFTWGQGFGYEEVDGLYPDGDFIYLSGWTTSESTSGDIAILKLDRQGKLVWARVWGGEGYDEADGQMVVDDAFIYVTGRVDAASLFTGGDAAVVKFDKQAGDYLTHVTWAGTAFDDGLGLTSDGQSLFVTGLTLSHGNGGQIFVSKYDKNLILLWSQLWGGPKGESARALEVDEQGNLLVAGSTASQGQGEDDVLLLQYSPDGTLNWAQTWGGPRQDAVHGLAIDGGVAFLVGNTASYSQGQNDALIIKVNSRTGQFLTP